MLKVGDIVPQFELPDASMEMLNISQFRGQNRLVLFFYTRDNAPQCTTEAIEFSDMEDEFSRHHTLILGISRDDVLSHADFREKHGLSTQLLSDEEGTVCRHFGVLNETQTNGQCRTIVERVTFIIDRDGTVRHIVPVAQAKGHAATILKLIKEMNECKSEKTLLSHCTIDSPTRRARS
jgi:peroxiredoxin Q/BCP